MIHQGKFLSQKYYFCFYFTGSSEMQIFTSSFLDVTNVMLKLKKMFIFYFFLNANSIHHSWLN